MTSWKKTELDLSAEGEGIPKDIATMWVITNYLMMCVSKWTKNLQLES